MPQDAAGDPVARCPTDCREAMRLARAEVERARRIPDVRARNRAITRAYRDLAADMPSNLWVRLASYVSAQAGCAMDQTQGFLARTVGRAVVNPGRALAALGDANLTIFDSVFPANRFMQTCGYRRLRECAASREIEVNETMMQALGHINAGNLRTAANLIAD